MISNKPASITDPVHSFEQPPVVETVIGVQFKQSPQLKNPLLALFWSILKPDFPNVEETNPVEMQYERFGDERSWNTLGTFNLLISQEPATRLRITNQQRSRMVQLQNGRIHYNWLATDGENYPRYTTVLSEFRSVLKKFTEFLEKNSLGPIEFDQWEITYVNHLYKGTLWNSLEETSKIFHSMCLDPGLGEEFRLDGFGTRISNEIKPQLGRLHVLLNHAKDKTGKETLRLDLTARGAINDQIDLWQGIEQGHRSIVNAFYNMTTEEAHKHWGYKNAR